MALFKNKKSIEDILRPFTQAIKDLESHISFHKSEVEDCNKLIENANERKVVSTEEQLKASAIIDKLKAIVG